MKTYLMPSIKLSFVLLLICSVIYPIVVAGIGRLAPGQGNGVKLIQNGRVVGYENVGQVFTQLQYFHGRPSAVNYNAAGSAGSNKGPSNPDYLAVVKARLDTFLLQNPTVKRADVPSELVTASGSGLDPDLSVAAATVQINRVATAHNLPYAQVVALVKQHTQAPLLGFLGPEKINVLKLNIALDQLAAGGK